MVRMGSVQVIGQVLVFCPLLTCGALKGRCDEFYGLHIFGDWLNWQDE